MKKILYLSHPILRQNSKDLKSIEQEDILLAEEMMNIMINAPGVGLAANQVGIDMNLMIIDVSHTDEAEDANIFVNGEIIESFGSSEMEEGCLSIPEVRLPVKRPEKIRFKYQLPDGSVHIDDFSGLLGRAIQHEMDHLKGIFIIDRVNPLLAIKYNKKLKEIEDSSISLKKSKHKKRDFVL